MTKERQYEYDGPHDWLEEKSRSWNENELRTNLMALSQRVDADDLQDIFQDEMDVDGYFDPQ